MLKRTILPLLLILFCLVLLLGGGVFFYLLTQTAALPATAVQHDAACLVLLGEDWAEATLAQTPAEGQTMAEAQTLALDETLAKVQALGGNAIALSGLLPDGSAMFRDKTKTLATSPALTAQDTFFAKFDAFAALVSAANARGIEVFVRRTQENADVASAQDALAVRYNLRLVQPSAEGHELFDPSTATGTALVDIATQSPEAMALSLQQVGTPAQLLLGEYTALCADSANLALFRAYYAGGAALPDLRPYLGDDYPRTLAVSYPTENGETVGDSTLFLMGTSDPTAPLTMNGQVIERFGTQGVWGVLVSLNKGENTFDFANGASALPYTVTYQPEGGGGGSSSGEAKFYTLPTGQNIQITSDIASTLSNAYNASTITQTLYRGAVAEATRYVTKADGTTPYAYQLTTGDWVRAGYCTLYNVGRTTLGEAALHEDATTRASVLTFAGGTPAVYHNWQGNTLTLTLLGTDYGGSAPASDWFSCTVGTASGNTTLTFTFLPEAPLYGWAVGYDTDANTTTLTLKRTPTLSDDETQPLQGVRVMLDAGHGLDDLGAMGAAGMGSPCEKDVNLALTMATKYRLEQLGATVLLTRESDVFPTLGDRVTALNTQHPDFFVSVHHNSLVLTGDLNNATGVEAYWFFDEGEQFATDLITAVSTAAGRKLRSANYGYYYVTRSNICPATLLEVGFMTNPWEYESVTDIDTIWAEAGAIAQTIYHSVAANSAATL